MKRLDVLLAIACALSAVMLAVYVGEMSAILAAA